ncbi:tyrosine-type recombinase/integrase [Pseudoduganella lutea]|uniref:Site-specific integrase n=1 Tax=Pseudoduganella lutea TaxID=321985 RepID=A0A4P6L4N5_9BURK|nr:site-specific integrase [Pseudoduganella lutea]QBE66447.1 site-specific integrase [Pseudoduganella lutea]
MARHRKQALTALGIQAKKDPGYYADGNGLYLRVAPGGTKSWIFRYMLRGRAREMGLGSVLYKPLAQAREEVVQYHQLLLAHIDPIEHRKAQRQKVDDAARKVQTFRQCATRYHATHSNIWRNPKSRKQWFDSLVTYVFPILGELDINEIGKGEILATLEPIWFTRTDTANRVRQRVKAVLDWASARDLRTVHDPLLWDQIALALPAIKDLHKPTHFPACPYVQVGAVIRTIQTSAASAVVKHAMEFAILTAARIGMVRLATWDEFDLEEQRWTLSAARMKAGVEFRVPLAPRALAILKARKNECEGNASASNLVFPTPDGKAFWENKFLLLLREQGMKFTMHGFRSTFRDWAAEQTNFPREVCEAALAHSVKNSTEAAYFRSDLFNKRRELMLAWAAQCSR